MVFNAAEVEATEEKDEHRARGGPGQRHPRDRPAQHRGRNAWISPVMGLRASAVRTKPLPGRRPVVPAPGSSGRPNAKPPDRSRNGSLVGDLHVDRRSREHPDLYQEWEHVTEISIRHVQCREQRPHPEAAATRSHT